MTAYKFERWTTSFLGDEGDVNDMMTAYESGRTDAQDGKPFCPEYFWGSQEDKELYAVGFLFVKPDCQAALSFIGNDEPYAEQRAADLAVDEAQATPRPGYDF